MEIPPGIFARARKLKRRGVEELFAIVYPAIVRMALALCGTRPVAQPVIDRVMRRGAGRLADWRDELTAARWFLHHTVLAAREQCGGAEASGGSARLRGLKKAHSREAGDDLLDFSDQPSGAPDPRAIAFIRALRGLPAQQREAVLLHLGEGLNARLLGVAMDCSTDAAQTHLDAAMAALRSLAGAESELLLSGLKGAYGRLTPAAEAIFPAVRRISARALRPRRIRRSLWGIGLAAAATAGIMAWRKWG